MSREEIIEKLRQILAEADTRFVSMAGHVREETDIRKDLGLSSTGMLYLLLSMEEAFGPNFDDAQIGSYETL